LHVKIDGRPEVMNVDTIVICAGQLPRRELLADLLAAGVAARVIGGADVAVELDARRAIDQGTRVALEL
jgi:2,4-dienoyl-CoA reductase (NADPH2)